MQARFSLFKKTFRQFDVTKSGHPNTGTYRVVISNGKEEKESSANLTGKSFDFMT